MEKTSPLTETAEKVAQNRYYHKNDEDNTTENWADLSDRVVNYVCAKETDNFKRRIRSLIYNTKFLPNSPCLVNAGRKGKTRGLLACFVTKAPEDTWIAMVDNIAHFGHIARQGGGCGVSLSNIRPEGDPVFGSTHAKACGPIEHMRMISEVMSSITQSGFRGMAMMATMMVDHPDIMRFIVCKQHNRALKTLLKEDIFGHYEQMKEDINKDLTLVLDKFLSNFNISVVANDDFMKKVQNDEDFELRFNGKVYQTLKAKDIFNTIVTNAWKNGDPGLLFYDMMNSGPYKYSNQQITATNPCGEQQLPEYGSCNLGSIDVSKFYDSETNQISWDTLRDAIRLSIQFLDDVIDANTFPTPEFAKWARQNRPVGLGIMGFADLLLRMKIAYGSSRSFQIAEELITFFEKESHKKSVELGRERGTPKCCRFEELEHRRNVTTLSIAPTGSISLLAGCSSAIEPIFSPTIYRHDNTGSYEMPHADADKRYFRCAVDPNEEKEVTWKDHVEMQSIFQKHVDSAISKTINMPNCATKEDISNAYMFAWKKGCKGITIYRDGCKTTQVLNTNRPSRSKFKADHAPKRPKELKCDIYKTRADGYEWHILVGKYDDDPYELFAVNGRTELAGSGRIVKNKRRHYSLLDEDGNCVIENLVQEESGIDPKISLETRRFSLELRHGIPPKYIVQQIDRSSQVITSFSKAVGRIFKNKYLTSDDQISIAGDVACPDCAKNNKQTSLIPDSGCWKCPVCSFAKCG